MLFTIGYANKTVDDFIKMLKKHNIKFLIDVRSTPFSRMFADYNKDKLKTTLLKQGITYSHMPDYFGARRSDSTLYSNFLDFHLNYANTVDFEKVFQDKMFLEGIGRITNGLKKLHNICLMCSEKYPYDCHRNIMVANYINKNYEYEIYNLIDLNTTMLQNEVIDWCVKNYLKKSEKIMKKATTLSENNLFGEDTISKTEKELIDFINSDLTVIEKSLKLRNIEIGYKKVKY